MGIAVAVLPLLLQDPTARPIDLRTLLVERVDRRALARLPSPPYVARQASSRDPASVSPTEGWFANDDAGHFVRLEEREGRTEGVMLDAEGPGAVVRLASPNPAGILRVYVDGSDAAVMAETMEPVLELPIPFARRCRITCDAPRDLVYQVEYRTYPPGTRVASLVAGDLSRFAPEIERTEARLLAPGEGADAAGAGTFTFSLSEEIPEGLLLCVDPKAAAGPRAITRISLRAEASDLALALRRAVLRMSFDGDETVVCPLGEFFASAPGLLPHASWPITVAKGADEGTGRPGTQGDLVCRWIMPYRERFDFAIDARGAGDLHVAGLVHTEPWTFDERSMVFHARWRTSGAIPTRPVRDWRRLAVEGSGVLVGDTLSIENPVKAWWGEGDEKIYVDGEAVPSHFGTGTADYYGCRSTAPAPFFSPLRCLTRRDGPAHLGATSMSRFRALDAIPFRTSLRFDVELWHEADCEVELSATTFYYARPGAKDDAPPIRAEDLPRPKPKPRR